MAENEGVNGTDVEAHAREMGWVPKEEFKGDPDKWTDAEAYIARGETFIPFLRANNVRLKTEREEDRRQIQSLAQQNKELQESIEALKEFNEETARQQHERARAHLLSQKKDAMAGGDHEAVVEIDEALSRLDKQRPPEKKKEPEKKQEQFDPMSLPWFRNWIQQNPWYGKDMKMTAYANAVGQEARDSGTPGGLDTFTIMAAETGKAFEKINGKPLPRGPKVEGSRGGAGAENEHGGKSYTDLPKEAKEACDRFAKVLVGPNRAYKTVDEWRKRYVSQYDWSGE